VIYTFCLSFLVAFLFALVLAARYRRQAKRIAAIARRDYAISLCPHCKPVFAMSDDPRVKNCKFCKGIGAVHFYRKEQYKYEDWA
jgi:hypothetical protein